MIDDVWLYRWFALQSDAATSTTTRAPSDRGTDLRQILEEGLYEVPFTIVSIVVGLIFVLGVLYLIRRAYDDDDIEQ